MSQFFDNILEASIDIVFLQYPLCPFALQFRIVTVHVRASSKTMNKRRRYDFNNEIEGLSYNK